MRSYEIAVIPGDGIGHDVLEEGIKVLDRAAEVDGGFRLNYRHFPWSCQYYLEHGEMAPKDFIATLADFHAIYLGAVGFPNVPDHVSLWGLLLPIRKQFEQYVNLRPIKLLPGVQSRLVGKGPAEIDFLCVRENTEGEYSGVGGRVHAGTPAEAAMQTGVFTRYGCERIMRYAFEQARTRQRKLTSATKSNALQYSMVFWDELFAELTREYPDVMTEKYHVDALAAAFITKPESFDVVVGSNLFADILTDLGGALQGSLGMPASANLNPEKRHPSMFEPVHGSAPDIAGRGIANPIAAVWAGAMMLEHLGEPAAAGLLYGAVEAVTAEGRVRTPDLGGRATTRDMGDAIREQVGAAAPVRSAG